MNPSVRLAAVLAAVGFSPSASAQTVALPAGLCPRAADAAPADPKAAEFFDASKETLDAAVRARLSAAGVTLEPKTCRLLAADGHALTRKEVAALKAVAGAGGPRGDDEKKNKDAGEAVAGVEAGGGAAGTYDDSTRRFDGANAESDGSALPGTGPSGKLPPEVQLSAALTADLQARFMKEDSGRELLARFTDAHGTVRLPPMTLTDLGGGVVPAQYDRPSKSVEIDQRDAARLIVAAAPEAERAALAKKLADPARLTAYMIAHPEARAAFLDETDSGVYHELVHAWQQRRDRRVEAVEGRDPVEWEREAYREEMRYLNEKMVSDPSLYERSGDITMYRQLMRGYPGFKQTVTELYQNGVGSSDFPKIEEIVAKRARAGRPGAASELAALRSVKSDYDGREEEFAAKTLPAMQAKAFPKLIDSQLSAGHPAEALSLAVDAPEAVRAAKGPAVFAVVRKNLESDPPAPVAERLKDWDAYMAYLDATTHTNTLDAGLYALYQRDRRAAVEMKLGEAAKAKDPDERSAALSWAKSYAAELPEKDDLLKGIAAAEARPAR